MNGHRFSRVRFRYSCFSRCARPLLYLSSFSSRHRKTAGTKSLVDTTHEEMLRVVRDNGRVSIEEEARVGDRDPAGSEVGDQIVRAPAIAAVCCTVTPGGTFAALNYASARRRRIPGRARFDNFIGTNTGEQIEYADIRSPRRKKSIHLRGLTEETHGGRERSASS